MVMLGHACWHICFVAPKALSGHIGVNCVGHVSPKHQECVCRVPHVCQNVDLTDITDLTHLTHLTDLTNLTDLIDLTDLTDITKLTCSCRVPHVGNKWPCLAL